MPEVVGHFGVESRFNTDLFQQPIELIEIVRGFEIFGQLRITMKGIGG